MANVAELDTCEARAPWGSVCPLEPGHDEAHDWRGRSRRRARVRDCSTCATDLAGVTLMPLHDASSRCESGGHPHCACDTCF